MAAAILWSLAENESFSEALRWGVATGTASAKLPGMSFASLEQARAVHSEVELRPITA